MFLLFAKAMQHLNLTSQNVLNLVSGISYSIHLTVYWQNFDLVLVNLSERVFQ